MGTIIPLLFLDAKILTYLFPNNKSVKD